MKPVLLLLMLFFLLAFNSGYCLIPIQNLISDLKDAPKLTDGKLDTMALGKKGQNTVILQLGTLKYIKEIKIILDGPTKLKRISLFTSENFIEWSNILEKKEVSGDVLDFEFNNVSGSFIKILIDSDSEFKMKEIECYDVSAPKNKIFNIKADNITENSAVVHWDTLVKSQGFMVYAKKMNGTKESLVEVDYSLSHSMALSKLLKGSDYVFRIVSQSPDGTKIESDQLEFRTKGIAFPEFWDLSAVSITPYSAKLHYRSNVPTSYEIYLGKNEKNLEKIMEEKKLNEEYEFLIPGLQPETEYFYKIVIKDKFGQVLLTPAIPFVTPADNLALGKKVIGTFNNTDEEIKNKGYGETTVDKAVDGNLNYFGGMALSYNADHSDQYVIIDLEKVEPIKKVEVFWWGLSFSKDYRIDISNDGKLWETVKEHLDASKGTSLRSPAGDLLVWQSVPVSKSARLVRLFVKAGSPRGSLIMKWEPRQYLYLSEVSVIKEIK